ncbi:MAG: NYN domain-containing protein [Anaerolineae bacterium]|nr:NYN domain-containing protein [Anaerolineae bacterium]
MEKQVAVYVDFENIALSAEQTYGKCDLNAIMEAAERWGRIAVRKAYCDWTGFSQYQQDLIEHSFELTQLFRFSSRHRKNAADIQMVVDALETAFTHPEIETFVLVTGDSDFSAVARKLRAYGKRVVGIGLRQSTSEVLVKACDHFILYDTLIEPDTRTAVYRLERARQLLVDAMHTLIPQVAGQDVNASALKVMMLKLDPTFNEADMGYQQFRDFVEGQSDLVDVQLEEKTLLVTLRAERRKQLEEEATFEYRVALTNVGLRLMDPHTRSGILRDLHQLLSQAPDIYTLDQAVLQLKAQYDAENVLRTREEVQEVVKLLRYTDVLDPHPQSWQLDPLTLKANIQAQTFVDYCESGYIALFMRKNLPIKPSLLASLLFGTLDQQARVERLAEIAEKICAESPQFMAETLGISGTCNLKEEPELDIIFQDLEALDLDEEPTLIRAAELNGAGLRIRTTDFEQARIYFLKAARMICDLLDDGEPGASTMDLEWYLASYCAATAGANFFRFDYNRAATYYLAFFALARETSPAWEKIQRLIQPLLSFYFAIAANEYGEMLAFPPGRTDPARIAVELYMHDNLAVRQHWRHQISELHRVNPAILRMLVQRLWTFEKTAEIEGTRETRNALEMLFETETA